MQVIYPDQYETDSKAELLGRFKKDGYFLIDAIDIPINDVTERERNKVIIEHRNQKINEIRQLVIPSTPIFLIKKNIFDIFYTSLIDLGFNVVNDEVLPFPSTGNQKKFREKFEMYWNSASLKWVKISNDIRNKKDKILVNIFIALSLNLSNLNRD